VLRTGLVAALVSALPTRSPPKAAAPKIRSVLDIW
jgi:hypothetical protein